MQEKNQEFLDLLNQAQISQKELAKIFDITETAISRWHKSKPPQYAVAYLQLRIENIRLLEQIQAYKVIIKAA